MIKGPLKDSDLFVSDPELFWRFKPNKVIPGINIPINNLGFRGEDYNSARFSKYNRVLCLGDSVTFSGEVRLGLGYPERLGYYLNKVRPHPLYKVINCGVPGYSSYQILKQYQKYVDIFKPSTIIVWTASNDRDLAVFYPDKVYAEEEAKSYFLRDLLRKSQFCIFLGSLIHNIQNKFSSHNVLQYASANGENYPNRVALDDFQ
jgi:lysophospholipase L1-like esterase